LSEAKKGIYPIRLLERAKLTAITHVSLLERSEKGNALQSRNSAETDLVLLHCKCNFQKIFDFL
jgi:hypothetical protein